MSNIKGPLTSQILTVAHMKPNQALFLKGYRLKGSGFTGPFLGSHAGLGEGRKIMCAASSWNLSRQRLVP